MSALIVFCISIFMIFGVFPMTLMIYATLRDKKSGYVATPSGGVEQEPHGK
jgi:hypothetical protein